MIGPDDPSGRSSATGGPAASGPRGVVSAAFTRLQDLVYVGLAVLLAVSAVGLLVHGGIELVRAVVGGDVRAIVPLLDRTLLTLMVVELLYTVQVSFREHTLVAEPFVLVSLIAAIRRILVITAEFGADPRPDETHFRMVMWELALLTVLIVVLVGSLVVLRGKAAAASPAAKK